MNFNIYLEDELGNNLVTIAEKLGKTRNSIIREALKDYIDKQMSEQWPETILVFKGIDEGIDFESYRQDLLPPNDERIFA